MISILISFGCIVAVAVAEEEPKVVAPIVDLPVIIVVELLVVVDSLIGCC